MNSDKYSMVSESDYDKATLKLTPWTKKGRKK